MQLRTRTIGAVVTVIALSVSLPLTVLAGEGEVRTGGADPVPVRTVEPAGDAEPEPVTDRTGTSLVEPSRDVDRPNLPNDRCLRLAENPRRCIEQEPSRDRCVELAEHPRRCFQDEERVERCADLADNPRRCVEPPSQHNFRQLFWRLIHAQEWKLLIRLLHALGLV